MTKKTLKITVLIVAIVGVFVALCIAANKMPTRKENKSDFTLGSLVEQMDSLRSLKEECANSLGIKDSAKFLKGITGYCDSRDGEIIELRNQINEMQKKDYEGLM